MRKIITSIIVAVATSLCAAGAASAATSTGSFQVTLTIQGSCSVQSASDLAFGSQTAIASALDATSSISVQCTNSTPYTVGLSSGAGVGATIASRLLTNASAATIPYTIYRDSGRTQLWGGTASVDTQGGTGNGSAQTFTAYGRVPSIVTPAAGSYADTISVTVTY